MGCILAWASAEKTERQSLSLDHHIVYIISHNIWYKYNDPSKLDHLCKLVD